MKGLDPTVEGQVEQIERQVEGRGGHNQQSSGGQGAHNQSSGGQGGGGQQQHQADTNKSSHQSGGDKASKKSGGKDVSAGASGRGLANGGKEERKEKEGDVAGKMLDERFNKWKTPLQRHVAYFDLNNDGFISPFETFLGLRRIGFGLFFALLGVFVINGAMSYPSCNGIIPDPFFRINIQNISRCKHGSDTGLWDMEGNFNEEKFSAMMERYDVDKKGGVSFSEGLKMMRDRRNIYDFFGWFAQIFEWGFTFALLANNKWVVPTDTLHSMFDGTLFFEMEKRHGMRTRGK